MSRWLKRSAKSPPSASTAPLVPMAPLARTPATGLDIMACFRLLLGREPDPWEIQGHMAAIGQPLFTIVTGYLNSLEFTRRGLLRTQVAAPVLAERDGYALYARPDDQAVGRHVIHGSYEPEVEAVFRSLLRPGMGVVDLGANLGYFTMLAAHLVGPSGYVLAVEPNPDNVRLIEASRRHNGFGHVRVAQLAAGREVAVLTLNATHSNGTTTPVADGLDAILSARTVACAPLDGLVEPGRRIDLLKLDVEGAEYGALLGAVALLERYKPTVITEFSPELLLDMSGIDGPGYLSWLTGLGYDLQVISADGGLEPAGQDVSRVMAAYRRRGTDHIDLLATPR